MSFIVICRDDSGDYVQATRRQFDTRSEADSYASTIAKGREPIAIDLGQSYGVVQTVWPRQPEPCAVLTSWQHESAITTAANESRPWTDRATGATRNAEPVTVNAAVSARETYHWVQTHEEYVDFDADNIPAANGYARVTFVTDKRTAYAVRSNPKATATNSESVFLDTPGFTVDLTWAEAEAIVGVKELSQAELGTASPENTSTGEPVNTRLLEALRALTDWAREHTSPRDANSPHDLLIQAVAVIEEADKLKTQN
jgi:hypothetical protein